MNPQLAQIVNQLVHRTLIGFCPSITKAALATDMPKYRRTLENVYTALLSSLANEEEGLAGIAHNAVKETLVSYWKFPEHEDFEKFPRYKNGIKAAYDVLYEAIRLNNDDNG